MAIRRLRYEIPSEEKKHVFLQTKPMRMETFVEGRIKAFASLGAYLRQIGADPVFAALLPRVEAENPFFTPQNVYQALAEWGRVLTEENLHDWLFPYADRLPQKGRRLALIMAGNLPLVGFHDYLCGLICGCPLQIRLSSKDALLLPFLHQKLRQLTPLGTGFAEGEHAQVFFTNGKMEAFDAIIATGSGNTFRYFDYYFGRYPHLLRHNRVSCAVLTGKETEAEIRLLGNDIFAYFGLGCRSVSKLYVPEGYDMPALVGALAEISRPLHQTACYRNNYDYHKSIFLVNRQAHLDNGSSLWVESEALTSPVSVVHYQTYSDSEALRKTLTGLKDSLQCVVGAGHIPFGQAQSPLLNDYADGVDTLDFLCKTVSVKQGEK